MDAYELYEGRQIQEYVFTSAANALSVGSGVVVPAGKVHTILAANYTPSVAETRTIYFGKVTRPGNIFPLTIPTAIALSTTIRMPFVTEGMEHKLFPGEYLAVYRDVATAGSDMTIRIQFIESDIPFTEYVERLKKVVDTSRKHGSTFRSTGGISTGGSSSGGFERPEGGGRTRVPEPV
jgi:uncharacterized membrane protein YgcG